MDLVELHPLRNVTIGQAGSGLAIEARKRVSIAVELVANPAIVFMDEPTSGALPRLPVCMTMPLRPLPVHQVLMHSRSNHDQADALQG